MNPTAPSQGNLTHSLPLIRDRKSTRLNSSHSQISYAVFCLKKKKNNHQDSACPFDSNSPAHARHHTLLPHASSPRMPDSSHTATFAHRTTLQHTLHFHLARL